MQIVANIFSREELIYNAYLLYTCVLSSAVRVGARGKSRWLFCVHGICKTLSRRARIEPFLCVRGAQVYAGNYKAR